MLRTVSNYNKWMRKRRLRVHASRFSHALIDLMRTAGGDAVSFQPNGHNLFLATLSLNM
jgi:hypothetical protein